MSLRIKFNVVMIAAFLVGLALATAFVSSDSQHAARQAVLSEAATMMAQVSATTQYTDAQVAPLLSRAMKLQFIPQAIPFYAAQQTFDALARTRPDYSYRQPADNPVRPSDRPAPWEADIIRALRAQPDAQPLVTERETGSGRILSLSQPVRVGSDCLACHSTPEAAPASMIDVYGGANGFGWKAGEIVGAQIVSVPEQVALARARTSTRRSLATLAAVFAVMLVLLNVLLHFFIIRPAQRISHTANEVSLGNFDVPEFDVSEFGVSRFGVLGRDSPRDEIGSLAVSFNRMRRSLVSAFKLLEQTDG